jgi:hypothetical protein
MDYPPRAATLINENPVIVRGTVTSGGGEIVDLRINGESVPVDGDRFSLAMSPEVGGNLIVVEVEDAIGGTRKKVQSFLWSTQYVPEGPMVQGLGMWLSQEVLDDGDRQDPPDDFAHIFEIVLASYDLASLLSGDLGTFAGFALRVRSVEHGAPRASLRPGEDVLHLTVIIPDLRVGLRAQGRFFGANGTLTASQIEVQAEVRLAVVDGALVVDLEEEDVTVEIHDANFQFSSFIFNLLAGWLVNSVLPGIVDDVENDLRAVLVGQIGPILQGALGALAFSNDITLPSVTPGGPDANMRLYSLYDEVTVDPEGVELLFDAGAYSLPEEIHDRNLGVMARVGCDRGPQRLVIPSMGEVELVLSDDLVNALLYAAWTSGWLDFEIPDELLGGFDFGALGIEDLLLTTTALLQPTAADCNEDGELILTIGDLQIDGSLLLFGEPVTLTLYASLQAGLEIIAQDGQIGFGLTSIERVDQEIVIHDERFWGLEVLIEELVGDNLVPALLDLLGGDALGGFPIPALDLGGAIEDFEGEIILTFEPLGLERIDGNNVIDARLGGGQ